MSVYAVSRIFFNPNMIQRINTFFTLFMIAMCLVFAYFALFTTLLDDRMNDTMKLVFAGIMITYAAFRTYRLVKAHRMNNNENFE